MLPADYALAAAGNLSQQDRTELPVLGGWLSWPSGVLGSSGGLNQPKIMRSLTLSRRFGRRFA